jgi:uncharacterized protein (TIGR02246 family)
MTKVLILATVGSISLVGAQVRAQVVTREMPMPPLTGTLEASPVRATPQPTPDAPDDLTIAREQYRAAASSRDAATLAEMFADDGVLVASEQAVIRGRQEIGKYFAIAFEQPTPDVTLTLISAESRDGFGSETGRFEERVTSSEGHVRSVSGVYVTIYRRDETGRWRVAIEIRSRGGQQPLGVW